MHVLMTESVFGISAVAEAELQAMGHQVSSCHGGNGICRAVEPGGACPLDGQAPVDLVIDVRGFEWELTAQEFGVVCAARAGIPVALVSMSPHRLPDIPPGLARHAWTYSADQLTMACDDVQSRECS